MKDWIPSVSAAAYAVSAIVLVAVVLCALSPAGARAESLEALLPYVIENHDRVRASKSRLSAARNRAREALGDWYPTLGQTANAGHEKQQNDNGDDSSTGFHEWDISLTQLLWDFGSTNAAIDKARLQVEEARYGLIETRQSLILEAITAYMNVIRSNAALGFAKDSEENIRRQTGLEEALVVLGSGFSTDVLQAKTQLAGAQARRAQSEGGLINALNRFQAVYGRRPDNLSTLEKVPFPASYLPQTLLQATDIALESNPSLKNAILAADIAVEDVRIARADNFFPKIEASSERKFKKNVGGTIGAEQETLAKVEMTFDFNLGFTAVNTLKASKSDLSATTFTAADTRRNIEEQVRNAWQQLDTAKQTASHLNNQANIAAAFLELARNERQLGRRSLIDVLSGETNLINAKSDAFSAETDVLIAAYGLLAATGQLEYDVITGSKGIEAPRGQLPASAPAAEIPAPSPVLPVTPATGRQNSEIEPDVTVAGGRSVKDLNALFQKIESPDVAALPDTIVSFGQSQSGAALSKPNHPPKPKSRYDSFADFDAHADTFTAVEAMDDDEFASSDNSALIIAGVRQTLPADSDTSVDAKATATDVNAGIEAEESVQADDTRDNVTIGDNTSPAADYAEIAEVSPRETPATISDDQVHTGNSSTFLKDVFTFLEAAHLASLADQASTSSSPSTEVSVAAPLEPKATPVPASAIESSDILASDTAVMDEMSAETSSTSATISDEDPISTLFGNVASFFEQSQQTAKQEHKADEYEDTVPLIDEAEAAPAVVEVASVPAASVEDIEADKSSIKAESNETGSNFNLLEFLEAAHQRKLADDARKSKPVSSQTFKQAVEEATAPQSSSATETVSRKAVVGSEVDQQENKPNIISFLGDLFSTGGEILQNMEYQPVTIDPLTLSDR
ncbi:TolC family protein [Thalassospiraceae bacterium LMO-JJ14]|nr:TolC family protein [Thalassospiraceae bacterium LMO-JJ14]